MINKIQLTGDQVKNLIQDYKNNIKTETLAEKYNRNVSSIYDILHKNNIINKSSLIRHKYKRNDKFHFLTLLENPYKQWINNEYRICVKCKCDCGKIINIICRGWQKLGSKSCGCYVPKTIKHGHRATKCKSNIYYIWSGVKGRCLNPKNKGYKWYSAKGVTLCNEWLDFVNFEKWAVQSKYEKGLTLNRIDSDKNYCPENCNWMSRADNTRWMHLGKKLEIKDLKQQVIQLQTENLKLNQIIDDINHSLILSTL